MMDLSPSRVLAGLAGLAWLALAALTAGGAPVISEFMASNTATLADQD